MLPRSLASILCRIDAHRPDVEGNSLIHRVYDVDKSTQSQKKKYFSLGIPFCVVVENWISTR